MLHRSAAEEAHTLEYYKDAISCLSARFIFAAAGNCVFISKTGDSRIVLDPPGVFGPIPDRLSRWIVDLGFFSIVCKTEFDLVLAYVVLHRRQDVDWSCFDLEDRFFLYCWCTGELIGLEGKPVHEH